MSADAWEMSCFEHDYTFPSNIIQLYAFDSLKLERYSELRLFLASVECNFREHAFYRVAEHCEGFQGIMGNMTDRGRWLR